MTFWSGETLKERLPDILGSEFSPSKIDCSAYTLTVGPEAYVTPDHRVQNPSRHTAAKLREADSIAIPAGQFGFLLTEESISMPDDAMAFISMKAKMKFRGLINVSGFHVDPGFSGRLIFSVFNAGPKPLHFKRGDDLFLIWFANLDCVTSKKKSAPPVEAISSELINGISGEIHSAHSLSSKIEELNRRLISYTAVIGVVLTIMVGVGVKYIVSNDNNQNGKNVTDALSVTPADCRLISKDDSNGVQHQVEQSGGASPLTAVPAIPVNKQENKNASSPSSVD